MQAVWAQGSDGGHGETYGQEAPWGAGEDASNADVLFGVPPKDDPCVRHRLERGEGGKGDGAEAQEVCLLWAPGVCQSTLRVFGAPMQGDADQAEGVSFLWGPGVCDPTPGHLL